MLIAAHLLKKFPAFYDTPRSITFSLIHQWLYSPLLGPGLFFSFLICTQRVGLPERGISPSQSRYLHTGQNKHKIRRSTHNHTHTHPWLEWYSNPWSQRSSERRQFMPLTARPLWPAKIYYYEHKHPAYWLNTWARWLQFTSAHPVSLIFNSFTCGLLNDALLSQTTWRRSIILPATPRSSKWSC
jgi:hypothetical protein